jgi:hypothetical protein
MPDAHNGRLRRPVFFDISRLLQCVLLSGIDSSGLGDHLMAMACEDFGRRASMVSFCRSPGVTCSGLVGRPITIRKYASTHNVNQGISDSC